MAEEKTEKRACQAETAGCACPIEGEQPKQETKAENEKKKEVNWWKRGVLIAIGAFFSLLILGWLLGQAAPKIYLGSGGGSGTGYGSSQHSNSDQIAVPQPSGTLYQDQQDVKDIESDLHELHRWPNVGNNRGEIPGKEEDWRQAAKNYNDELSIEHLSSLSSSDLKGMGLLPSIDTSSPPQS